MLTLTLLTVGIIVVLALLLASASVGTTPVTMPAVEPPAVVQVYHDARGIAGAVLAASDWEQSLLDECAAAAAADAGEFLLAYQVGGHNVIASPHAVERHGAVVYEARVAFGQNDPRRQRRECPATDRAINITPIANGDWAVMIEMLSTGRELTCWTLGSDPVAVSRQIERLFEMHKCPPDPDQLRTGHDFYSNEVR